MRNSFYWEFNVNTRKVMSLLLIGIFCLSLIYLQPNSDKTNDESILSDTAESIVKYQPTEKEGILNQVDKDDNKIDDQLDTLILEQTHNDPSSIEQVEVIVMADSPKFTSDLNNFVDLGGELNKIWDSSDDVFNGFAGSIPLNVITKFAQLSSSSIDLIEQDREAKTYSNVANKLLQLQPEVWGELNYTGDPNSAIAIMDTGIDDSHPAFGSGYTSNGDWSSKIVAWHDVTSDASTTPEDFGGHGSHVAGIAGALPYNNSYDENRVKASNSLYLTTTHSPSDYGYAAFNINDTGTVSLNYTWSAISGNPSSGGFTIQGPAGTFSNTSSSTNEYSISFQVSSSSDFGLYVVYYNLDIGSTEELALKTRMVYPFSNGTDNFARYSGVASDTKLVGVKIFDRTGSGTGQDVIDGFNWIANNKETYNITIASGSFGFGQTVSSVDTAAADLVNEGVVVVIAAGNAGQTGSNQIYSPGHVDEVITVGATDDNNDLTGYSSQGPGDSSTTIKPDIVAPGGDIGQGAILQVDSNDKDADGQLSDYQADDFTALQGTSMATPAVSGVIALMIEAMGGHEAWSYGSNAMPMKIKQHLLATAHEIYQDDDGGKNKFEGYGMINPDAAITSISEKMKVGQNAQITLSPNKFDSNVWSKQVSLHGGVEYNFTLDNPSGGDYDLFLYKPDYTTHGQPIVEAKNITAIDTKRIEVVPSTSGKYILAIKPNYGNSGGGEIVLTSTSPGLASDDTNPLLTDNNNVTYAEGNSNKLIWSANDSYPDVYEIFNNGTKVVADEFWDNTTSIEFPLGGLPVGVHNITIVVYDLNGNWNSSTTFVTIFDGTPPTIDNPTDIKYEEGTTGHNITWNVSDKNPNQYTLYQNGSIIKQNPWTNDTITHDIDGLSLGTYNFTLRVSDDYNNTATDEVFVEVFEVNEDDNDNGDTTDETKTNDTTTSATPNIGSLIELPVSTLFIVGAFVALTILSRKYRDR